MHLSLVGGLFKNILILESRKRRPTGSSQVGSPRVCLEDQLGWGGMHNPLRLSSDSYSGILFIN